MIYLSLCTVSIITHIYIYITVNIRNLQKSKLERLSIYNEHRQNCKTLSASSTEPLQMQM